MKIIRWTLRDYLRIIKEYGFSTWFHSYTMDRKTKTDAFRWTTKVEIIIRTTHPKELKRAPFPIAGTRMTFAAYFIIITLGNCANWLCCSNL